MSFTTHTTDIQIDEIYTNDTFPSPFDGLEVPILTRSNACNGYQSLKKADFIDDDEEKNDDLPIIQNKKIT